MARTFLGTATQPDCPLSDNGSTESHCSRLHGRSLLWRGIGARDSCIGGLLAVKPSHSLYPLARRGSSIVIAMAPLLDAQSRSQTLCRDGCDAIECCSSSLHIRLGIAAYHG